MASSPPRPRDAATTCRWRGAGSSTASRSRPRRCWGWRGGGARVARGRADVRAAAGAGEGRGVRRSRARRIHSLRAKWQQRSVLAGFLVASCASALLAEDERPLRTIPISLSSVSNLAGDQLISAAGAETLFTRLMLIKTFEHG